MPVVSTGIAIAIVIVVVLVALPFILWKSTTKKKKQEAESNKVTPPLAPKPTPAVEPVVSSPSVPRAFVKIVSDGAETFRILEKAGIPASGVKTKTAFKSALNKLTKKEIDYLADRKFNLKLDGRLTKPKMIDVFVNSI